MHRTTPTELKVSIPCILPESIVSIPNSQINAFFSCPPKADRKKRHLSIQLEVDDGIFL